MMWTAAHTKRRGVAVAAMLLVVGSPVVAGVQSAGSAPRPPAWVRLWDTVSALRGQADAAPRKAWRRVTPGSGVRLQGDLVVEAEGVAAAFASRLGSVLVYSSGAPSQRVAEVRPAELAGKRVALTSTALTEKDGVVTVRADFRAAGARYLPISFSFGRTGIVSIAAEGSTRGINLSAPLEAAIVPSFVGDDLIYDARDYPSAQTLAVVSEHWLLGLLKGEDSMLVVTWQEGIPSVRITLSASGRAKAGMSAVTFLGGKGLSLAVLDAPGIWHRASLEASAFLERDRAIRWKPPFPAVWLTQLYEDEVKTTFEFRHGRERVWRGGVGHYTYPAWFSGEKTMLSLGKKIPPEGEAIIYFLERSKATPPQVLSPTDIAERTLTGGVLAGLLDVAGRPAWYPHREDSVIGGATCGVTDALKEIFDAGQEVEKQAIVKGGVEDMYAYLTGMFERNARFHPFAKDLIAFLDAQAQAKPKLGPFLRGMRSTAEEMVTTYDNARDTIRDVAWAQELGARTVALAAERRPDNPQRFAELKQDWTSMGGALEELARKEHTLTRKLYQQAGYGAAIRLEAMPAAMEVRRRTKACLERPESYEIWANY